MTPKHTPMRIAGSCAYGATRPSYKAHDLRTVCARGLATLCPAPLNTRSCVLENFRIFARRVVFLLFFRVHMYICVLHPYKRSDSTPCLVRQSLAVTLQLPVQLVWAPL
jgi:hypothetical protein